MARTKGSSPGVTTRTGLAMPLPENTRKDDLIIAYQALHREYERFRQSVTDLIMSHESCDGCLDGRIEAVKDLGLIAPSLKRRVTVEFTIDPDWISPGDEADEMISLVAHRTFNVTGFRDFEVVEVVDA